jgi:hypothetical protein
MQVRNPTMLLELPGVQVEILGNEDWSTPLINVATYMAVDSVELLVRHGIELDTWNAVGDTKLIMAVWKGDKSCMVLLCVEDAPM